MTNREKLLIGLVVALSATVYVLYTDLRQYKKQSKENFDRESKMFKDGTLKYNPK